MDRAPAEAVRELHGALERAVRHDELAEPVVEERARDELAVSAGADQERRAAVEAAEHLARELHARATDAHGLAADVRLVADALRDLECLVHHLVEHGPHRLVGLRHPVRVPHLPDDLRLADHHRVETRDDAEHVPERLLLLVLVEVRLDGAERSARAIGEPLGEALRPDARRRHGVELDAVARGQQEPFPPEPVRPQRGEHLGHALGAHRELLAKLDGRRVVADTDRDQPHYRAPRRLTRPSRASRRTRRRASP